MEITDMQLHDEQIKSMMENGENRAPVKRGNGRIGEETTDGQKDFFYEIRWPWSQNFMAIGAKMAKWSHSLLI